MKQKDQLEKEIQSYTLQEVEPVTPYMDCLLYNEPFCNSMPKQFHSNGAKSSMTKLLTAKTYSSVKKKTLEKLSLSVNLSPAHVETFKAQMDAPLQRKQNYTDYSAALKQALLAKKKTEENIQRLAFSPERLTISVRSGSTSNRSSQSLQRKNALSISVASSTKNLKDLISPVFMLNQIQEIESPGTKKQSIMSKFKKIRPRPT